MKKYGFRLPMFLAALVVLSAQSSVFAEEEWGEDQFGWIDDDGKECPIGVPQPVMRAVGIDAELSQSRYVTCPNGEKSECSADLRKIKKPDVLIDNIIQYVRDPNGQDSIVVSNLDGTDRSQLYFEPTRDKKQSNNKAFTMKNPLMSYVVTGMFVDKENEVITSSITKLEKSNGQLWIETQVNKNVLSNRSAFAKFRTLLEVDPVSGCASLKGLHPFTKKLVPMNTVLLFRVGTGVGAGAIRVISKQLLTSEKMLSAFTNQELKKTKPAPWAFINFP